jgi:acyl-coenzyme A synthetase/AMP-(fatty) acid ligase
MRPVGVGTEGELYIGGEGVAKGYLNHDDITKQRFLPDPFSRHRGARMYRTGDIVRYRPDGNLVWLGRADSQFKINGLRIEPGEIEAVLSRSPAVAEAVVVAQPAAGSGGKIIAAFVTAAPRQTLSEQALRELAAEHLPPLMVPRRFVLLPELPLTISGKVDRAALERMAG